MFRIPLLNALTGNLKTEFLKGLKFSCLIYVAVLLSIYSFKILLSAKVLTLTLISS